MPFLFPLYTSLVGVSAGYFVGRRFRGRIHLGTLGLLLVGVLIAASAFAANSAQRFYDLGVSIDSAFLAEGVGIFIFCFTLAFAWSVLSPARTRWLLFLAAPFGLAQPILVAWMLVTWSLNGFAP